MAQYMLLLYDDPSGWAGLSPEEMQKAIEKYVAWGEEMGRKETLVAGHKLADDAGKVIRGNGGQTRVTDGPYSEAKEVLGGYYLIEADGYDQAVAIGRDHPHVGFGGTIEVRKVDEIPE